MPRRSTSPRSLAWMGLVVLVAGACAHARISHEVATFQRELDDELAASLSPGPTHGLEAACHADAIVWMHLDDGGRGWKLTSVDARGRVGIWSARGLEQTWSLDAAELERVETVRARLDASEDMKWLRDRARVPLLVAGCGRSACYIPFIIDIAPRDRRRWVGVHDHFVERRKGFDGTFDPLGDERHITASGRWFAVGDASGNLAVAPFGAEQTQAMWMAPGCERLRWAGLGAVDEGPGDPRSAVPLEFVTVGSAQPDRERIRHLDLARGTQALLAERRRGEFYRYNVGFHADSGLLLLAYLDLGRHWTTEYLERMQLATDGGPPSELETLHDVSGVTQGRDWVVLRHDGRSALIQSVELSAAQPQIDWRETGIVLSANDRFVATGDETSWVVEDRDTGELREIELEMADEQGVGIGVGVSNDGALAAWTQTEGGAIVELSRPGEESEIHELDESVFGVQFVESTPAAADTLWIGVAGSWDFFKPMGRSLLRLDRGAPVVAHEIAAAHSVVRVLGRAPVSPPTLVWVDDGGLGIERLDDRQVLRAVVHDHIAMTTTLLEPSAPSHAGVSLIWLDVEGRPMCRFDGTDDDHVDRPERRIDDPELLVRAFLSGEGCPRE